MIVSEIYRKYKINKGLQEHMLRVAAVAKQICDSVNTEVDVDTVVKSCLLHDMGNLIKSKLDSAPELFEPEGVEYWEKVKAEMIKNYGSDVHVATLKIVSEVTNEEKIIALVNEMAFDEIKEIAKSGSLEVRLALYADMRIGFNGVISIDARFDDIRDRYVPRGRFTEEELELRRSSAKQIEKEIFTNSSISPEDITDESTAEIQKELLKVEI